MVERQLRRRGIADERVLEAMARGAARAVRARASQRRRAYRDGALRIGEGQTISQPWIVARMAELLELRGDERVLEVGTGSGYGGRGAVAAAARRWSRSSATRRSPSGAAARSPARATTTSRCASATAPRARPTARPSTAISVTATATGGPPRGAARAARARRARSSARSTRERPRAAGALPRRRAETVGRCASCRWSRDGEPLKREFSAGGLVVRASAAGLRRRDRARARRRCWRCPRAIPTRASRRRRPPQREVREETGLDAELVEKLGDVRYWYTLDGERVLQGRELLPLPLPLGQRARPRPRGRGRVDPARGRARAAGLRAASARWPQAALSQLGGRPIGCRAPCSS